MSEVLITGANRGLGLAFARHCLQRGDTVHAACRDPDAADDLAALVTDHGERCRPLRLDVGDETAITVAAANLAKRTGHLDLLIHNAGTLADGESGVAAIDADAMLRVFRVNLLGPLLLTRAVRPLLAAADKPLVACLTSRTGALREGMSPGANGGYSYPCSKAALARAIPQLAADLRAEGITVLGIDPGWVATGMTAVATGDRYQLSPDESVAGMLAVFNATTLERSGELWRWNGEPSRWYGPPESDAERQVRTADSSR